MHGYAITAHLAQGMTCRETFILATDQLTREAGYVALSRGRESNRLYALTPTAGEREEYAPTQRGTRDARAALVDGLQRSRAQTLASDIARRRALPTSWPRSRGSATRLERTRWRAHGDRRRLEDKRPPWYRPRARSQHAASARRSRPRPSGAPSARCVVLASRQDALRDQLRQERAASREPAQAREPERPFARRPRPRDGARPLMTERLLTPADVAERCQISAKTVLRAIHRGRLRASRLGEQRRLPDARSRRRGVDRGERAAPCRRSDAPACLRRSGPPAEPSLGRLVLSPDMGRGR